MSLQPRPGAFSADYDVFVATQVNGLMRSARALTGSHEAAQDLVQDSLVKLWRNWSRISTYDRPDLWLRRVLTNAAISRKKSLMRWPPRLGLYWASHRLVEPGPDAPAASVPVWGYVRRLPARQRQAIVLRYVGDLSTSEIAEVMEIEASTVRVLVHQAHERLRRDLIESSEE